MPTANFILHMLEIKKTIKLFWTVCYFFIFDNQPDSEMKKYKIMKLKIVKTINIRYKNNSIKKINQK